MRYVVTGATGHLGRLVVAALLRRVAPHEVVAAVRSAGRAEDLAERGIEVRHADYDRPEHLAGAFRPGEVVLLISGNDLDRRATQHQRVVRACAHAGVARLCYTSILGCPDADFELARAHQATEAAILGSGLPYSLLRNGWYSENYTERIPLQLEHGVVGATGEGRIGAAPRADLAAAAAEVLVGEGHAGRAYELSGDAPFTLADYAAELSRQVGREVPWHDLPPEAFRQLLVAAGVPEALARIHADLDAAVARGRLEGGSGELRRLLGRPTTPIAVSIAEALRARAPPPTAPGAPAPPGSPARARRWGSR